MTDERITATELARRDQRLEIATRRLLESLREWMRAVPYERTAEMPEHSMHWYADINGTGPASTIQEALKMYPELWLNALPDTVCIVPKDYLWRMGKTDDAADYMTQLGESLLRAAADRAKWAHEEQLWQRSVEDKKQCMDKPL